MYSHVAQQPRFPIFEVTAPSEGSGFNIFNWFRLSRASMVPFQNWVGNSKIFNFFTRPNNVSVFGLPWTSATKIWLFQADSGPLEGRVPFQILGEINLFTFFNPTIPTMLVPGGRRPEWQWTPLVPSNQDLTFLVDSKATKGH